MLWEFGFSPLYEGFGISEKTDSIFNSFILV